jgi:hypothetical protein
VSRRLECDIFETTEPGRIVAVVDEFCREHLRAGVAAYEFFASSVGSVHGLRLTDGRRVVLKAHRREADVDHLAAIQRVQAVLADAGFPAPRSLLAPTPIAQGIAVVETLIDEGERADAHDRVIRRAVAAGLARLIQTARSLPSPCGLVAWRDATQRLWRHPHDRRFDFAGTAESAAWIDELAAQARRQLDEHAPGPSVIGHGDWRVEHLRFHRGALSAVYDWDSWRSDQSQPSRARPRTRSPPTGPSMCPVRCPSSKNRWRSSTTTSTPGPRVSAIASGASPGPPSCSPWPTAPAASTQTS